MTTTMQAAKERQLDWLLDETLGGERAAMHGHVRGAAKPFPWLAAAVALLAIGACVGVALLRETPESREVQQPATEIPWLECHGAAGLDKVPAEVTALRCFDFDDAACARLAKFSKLQHLDLSGMDVNDQGYAVSLKITDAGVRALAPLTSLRSLSLAGCEHLKGFELRVLEAMPRLETLDLEHSGIEAEAVWRLARLPSLRSLSMSYCMNFHGSVLAEVASLPGLRKLELRGCVTLSAKDAMVLGNLKQLRHLDLRDCQGRFRGQTLQVDAPGDTTDLGSAKFGDKDDDGIPDVRILPPVQDGIGITDAVVEALAALPLETLLLGGSESLTDAIGKPLAKMTKLRSLDLSNLPKTTGALLAKVPAGLEALALDHNPQFATEAFASLPRLTTLREFGLAGLALEGPTLKVLLRDKNLEVLRIGGSSARGKDRPVAPRTSPLTGAAAVLADQRRLESLDLSYALWVDAEDIRQIATLPRLRNLDLTATLIGQHDDLAPLAKATSLRRLDLTWCEHLDDGELAALAGASLRELRLYGTNLKPASVREATKALHGCLITMPNGTHFLAE